MWTFFFYASLAILSCLSLAVAFYAVRIARARTESPRATLASFASKIASIESFQEEQAETLKQLANRVKMQRVRTAIHHTEAATVDSGDIKSQLRRQAGLVAGKPAPHQ
jgi:septal ring factor EnvC (AmiA/AmiB activator)